MTNNDIMRRVRYIFDFNDSRMIALFKSTGYTVTRPTTSSWLKRDDDPDFLECTDEDLARFLNGMINFKRGKKDGPQPIPEKTLTNNLVLRKLKIALDLRDDGMLEILKLGNREMSKHELSAFFRKPGHKHYRECKDQVLRNFLAGLQTKYRAADSETDASE